MGESRDPETQDELIAAAREQAQVFADHDMPDLAERFRAAADFPERVVDKPLVLDTDLGGDPGAAVAVAIAALNVPELLAVVTSQHGSGRFARRLLDACGRTDVRVFTCADEGDQAREEDALAAAADLCRSLGVTIRWAALGPLSTLATMLTSHPDLAPRWRVTTGPALLPAPTVQPTAGDLVAARTILDRTRTPDIVRSEEPSAAELSFSRSDPLYRQLGSPTAPEWARLIAEDARLWFENTGGPGHHHYSLTLSCALRKPFVFGPMEHVVIDGHGRSRVVSTSAPEGAHEVFLCSQVAYDLFGRWLADQVSSHLP